MEPGGERLVFDGAIERDCRIRAFPSERVAASMFISTCMALGILDDVPDLLVEANEKEGRQLGRVRVCADVVVVVVVVVMVVVMVVVDICRARGWRRDRGHVVLVEKRPLVVLGDNSDGRGAAGCRHTVEVEPAVPEACRTSTLVNATSKQRNSTRT